ncbi:uncharacterized protein TNCV_1477761 [Trichonephila clavipes]|nr:uncharacterized protein TNCV_1477761 [Trichonephila clavipes]
MPLAVSVCPAVTVWCTSMTTSSETVGRPGEHCKKYGGTPQQLYAIPNVKDAELTAIDEDLHLLEVHLESLEVRIETILSSSKKSSSGAVMKTNDNFEIKTKIPPLVLPEFSGKYEEFSSFKIQLDDLITNNN